MLPIPGVTVQHQGDEQAITDYLDVSVDELEPPEGTYWYAVTARARNKKVAEGKARAAVRTDYPTNLSIASITHFLDYPAEDSQQTLYSMIVGIDPKV